MTRTSRRPIPSGKIRPGQALGLALLLILSGEGLLLFTGNTAVPLLGAVAVCWYNVLYTGLKKVSAFAVVPGALVGAIPPVMGWAAGGGSAFGPAPCRPCLFLLHVAGPPFLAAPSHLWERIRGGGTSLPDGCFQQGPDGTADVSVAVGNRHQRPSPGSVRSVAVALWRRPVFWLHPCGSSSGGSS